MSKDNRYQFQPWYVKLWRRIRHQTFIPYYAVKGWLNGGGGTPFKRMWSIEVGVSHMHMDYVWTWDEVKNMPPGLTWTERACMWIESKRDPDKNERITIEVQGKPYLTRSYLPKERSGTSLFLHHFHMSDVDKHLLHNHPFKWGLSLILSGGYVEEYKDGQTVKTRTKKRWSFNFITQDTFHRVDLLNEKRGCWTLFLAGPRTKDWCFYDKASGEFLPRSINPGSVP